jgi:hypothetical protein
MRMSQADCLPKQPGPSQRSAQDSRKRLAEPGCLTRVQGLDRETDGVTSISKASPLLLLSPPALSRVGPPAYIGGDSPRR